MGELVLSLFPGIGLLDMAFEQEGFCVVRGPDLLWGGDVRNFHPPAGKFDGVIGGPPCQRWSRLAKLVRAVHGERALAPDLIPEFARIVAVAEPEWFLMENVPDAPLPQIAGYGMVDRMVKDVAVGGLTSRTRRFTYGRRGFAHLSSALQFHVPTLALHSTQPERSVVRDTRDVPVAIGGSGKRKRRPGQNGGGTASHEGPRLPIGEMLRRQGFPTAMLDDCPLTDQGKKDAVGNGVPLPMGHAIARAVRQALGLPLISRDGGDVLRVEEGNER